MIKLGIIIICFLYLILRERTLVIFFFHSFIDLFAKKN